MKKNKVDIITLGCSKNLVDSEQLMRQFAANGFNVSHDAEKIDGEIVVVNTCGFIGDAQQESIDMIIELEEAKKRGRIGKLFVMGCLSERFMTELRQEIQGVDRFYGKFDWKGILSDIGKTYHADLSNDRILTTPPHYAYLKIGEGCNRHCSYCSIPIVTGHYRSRPMEEIVGEVETLVGKGVKELQVIAQDLTYYGMDLYRRYAIAELVERLSDIQGVEWIRLHYAYPVHFPYDLLRVMHERANVCKYLDIALQHISDKMLQKMRRHITKKETYELLHRLRAEVPGIHLRTTLMVGHPGETDDDFQQLLDFTREMRFERLGAFAYSHETGTYSYLHYQDEISDEIKQSRLDSLMDLQQQIAAEVGERKVGSIQKVVIDRLEGGYYVGRTEFDSPEVDPEVLIEAGQELSIGHFYDIFIEKSDIYEMYGKVVL